MTLRHFTRGATLLAAALAACSSLPAPHYYALAAVTPAGPTPLLAATLIRVRHISLPTEMDHRGLTHHVSATELSISDTDQWSAPLGELIQGTITRDLGQRLGFDHVLAPEALPVGLASRPAVKSTTRSAEATGAREARRAR